MLAGGMTIAAPSMMPQAHAAGQLYVSAENALFGNTFGGAQVVEVVVIDPQRQRTDIAAGEPTVRVDNNILRMAQAADGNWYGYFGDVTAIRNADAVDNNLDFGDPADGVTVVNNSTGPIFTQMEFGGGVLNQAPELLSNHTQTSLLNGQIGLEVEADPNMGNAAADQLNLDDEWPFIQTYDLTIETFEVIFEKAGADEVVVLDYNNNDLDDYALLELDRSAATQGAHLHLTITDNQLNIDPTAEDVVMFYIGGTGDADDASYVSFTNGTSGFYDTLDYKAYNNSFSDNGKLIVNNNTNSAANEVLNMSRSLDDMHTDQYLVFWETSENSGIFVNTDDDDASNITIAADAKRGTTATFDYND